MVGKCQYCHITTNINKQGVWGDACSGCKTSLTKMLRDGRFGSTYDSKTKRRLLQAQFDWTTRKWVVPEATVNVSAHNAARKHLLNRLHGRG